MMEVERTRFGHSAKEFSPEHFCPQRSRTMKKRRHVFLKTQIILLVRLAPFALIHAVCFAEPIIIGHTCTDISQIPQSWINKAKNDFRIS